MIAMPLHPEHRRRRGRNLVLALSLVGLVVLFFFITIAKLGGGAP